VIWQQAQQRQGRAVLGRAVQGRAGQRQGRRHACLTVVSSSQRAACTVGSSCARYSCSCSLLILSSTSFRPVHTPCRVDASGSCMPLTRMGMICCSTLSPILRTSSPRHRPAICCLSSPAWEEEAEQGCHKVGGGCLPVINHCIRKKGKEKNTPFGINLMRSPVLYRAAQGPLHHLNSVMRLMTNSKTKEMV
jgi:hypothetical protein